MTENYTPEQREAVCFGDGVMELVAGPGSGKTFVVTRRIRELIRTHGVSPDHILVITFTKAAAEEMKKRFMSLCRDEGSSVAFGTFHAVFYRILRSCPDYKSIKLVPDRVRFNYITDILKRQGLSGIARDGDLMQSVTGALSRAKNEGGIPENLVLPVDRARFMKLLSEYNEALSENGFLDFDDMVILCRKVLTEDPSFLQKWQDRFSHILIDEFQDICLQQYETVKLLAAPENNIFVVGDDDQSIYGFRGARPEIMERFFTDFPGCRRVCLSVNFRSCPEIIAASAAVIGANKKRIHKDIVSGTELSGEVRYVGCASVDDVKKELVKHAIEAGDKSTAVLCRKNRLCTEAASLLVRAGASCLMKESVRSKFDWFFVRDMLAYMDCAAGRGMRRELLLKIINRPVRYIRRGAFASENVNREDVIEFYNGNRQMQEAVTRMFRDLDRISHLNPFLAVNYIRRVMGYDYWALSGMNSENRLEYSENADDFQRVCAEAGTLERLHDLVDRDIREMKKLNELNERKLGSGIRIMSFHGSKGLEFDKVILPFVNEGVVPVRQSHSMDELEEERRMLYVAMTRARKELTLIYADSEKDTPSRFIQCLIDPYDRTGKWNSMHLKA